MIKTILAAVVAGAFLISVPVRAEEKAPGEKTEKAGKGKKKEKKADKGGDDKTDEKAAGGW